LKRTDDDIFFVGKLHHALEDKGYSVGDDGEDMVFWDATENSLLTFQVGDQK
jgi:hypothetical protein